MVVIDGKLTLKQWLGLRGYTITQFSEEVGVAYVTAFNWVNGKRLPNVTTANRIVAVLGVNHDQIDWLDKP